MFFFLLFFNTLCFWYEIYSFFCIRLHFTTKRQSQIIAFVSIVYVFFASSSVLPFRLQWIHSKEFTCFDSLSVCFCYYSGYDVAYCGICECVCSFRLGFLIYLHVARCVARVVHTIRILYSSKAELAGYTTLEPIARNENCIKRIDNEFTRQILLRVLATVNVWRVEAATKWNIEQFHKVNGMSLIHTISLFTANIFINHQYSFTCSIKFEKLWLYGIIYTFSRKMLFCICDPSLVALLIVCTGHRKNRQKSHAHHFKLGKYRLRASTKLFTIHTIESS